jgi:hypothetical protein
LCRHLAGVHTIYLKECDQISDAGISHLTGLHTIDLWNCNKITDVGLQSLAGVDTITIGDCQCVNSISAVGLRYLIGLSSITVDPPRMRIIEKEDLFRNAKVKLFTTSTLAKKDTKCCIY